MLYAQCEFSCVPELVPSNKLFGPMFQDMKMSLNGRPAQIWAVMDDSIGWAVATI